MRQSNALSQRRLGVSHWWDIAIVAFVGLVDWANIRRLGSEQARQALDDTGLPQFGKPFIQPQQDTARSYRADDHAGRLPAVLLSDLKGNGLHPLKKIWMPEV